MQGIRRIALALVCVALTTLGASAQTTTGPDVIVGSLPNVSNYGSVGGISAFAVGTTSCNLGDTPLSWVSNTNQHPVIGQNMYRLANGRMAMIGQSWLKHGFLALSGSLCGSCTGPGGSQLDPGCSDPYSSSLNGSQSGLGPRSQVNAATGFFPYPFGSPSTPATIGRRLQVPNSEFGIPGAQYFVEGHYVTPDDAAAGNHDNNASYRPINVSGGGSSWNISVTGSTEQQKPALQAWSDIDPDVVFMPVDIPGDGRFHLAWKATLISGGYHNEFALHNLNSHRSARGFTINTASAATFSNLGFHDVAYHSGDGEPIGTNYSGTDWSTSNTASSVTWQTGTAANANALRWGTTYNFWCDSTEIPTSITITLYRPGSPTTFVVNLPNPFPDFGITYPNGTPATITPNTPTDVDITIVPITGGANSGSGLLFTSTDGGPFTSTGIAHLGGNSFRATLPATNCLSTVDWYVSFTPAGGGAPVLEPSDAPTTTHSALAAGTVAFSDDFENDLGWTVSGNATDGQWDRGVPVGNGDRGDPAVASTGSGQCYLTDNVDGNSDVDGGSTTLTSPVIDLSGLQTVNVRFFMWHDNVFGGNPNEPTDTLDVEITDDGINWVTVESYGASVDAWVERNIDPTAHGLSLTANFQIRFTSTDVGGGSVVESGIDEFSIITCSDPLALGPCGAGNVGISSGGPFDVLTVNGSAGGGNRRVDIGHNVPITFAVSQPSVTATPAPFAIFGKIGLPGAGDVTTLPFGIGQTCFNLCVLNPGDVTLFSLTNNFGPANCASLVGSTAAPWSFTYNLGLGFDTMFALQGVIADDTGTLGLGVTNGVLVRITSNP